ncbi:MAG: GLPGLI family protein [Bacteroidota bacterium]
MKIRQIYILCFLFFAKLCCAQSEGVASYAVNVVENEDDVVQQQMKLVEPNILDYVEDLSFQLTFAKKSSYFVLEDKLYESQTIADAASLLANYATSIIKIEDKFYTKNANSKPVNPGKWVVSESDVEWQITQESKKIDDFTVYKATGIYKKGNLKAGYKKMTATAWFCPEIPLPYGPLKFGGLPGLIIELSFENVTYGLEKIVFKSVEIPEVDMDNTVSAKDDEEKMQAMFNN